MSDCSRCGCHLRTGEAWCSGTGNALRYYCPDCVDAPEPDPPAGPPPGLVDYLRAHLEIVLLPGVRMHGTDRYRTLTARLTLAGAAISESTVDIEQLD